MTRITCTATLDVARETAETLARLLREHRERLGGADRARRSPRGGSTSATSRP
ncbi:hypothetical protein [Streptomyces sennicomposti]